ncbi:unnamed protein product [Coccothraustes coccothraustes]
MRSPLSRLFSKPIKPNSPSPSSYERCSSLPITLAALRWSRAFPAPSTHGRAASGLQRSSLNPNGADTNHSGGRSFGPAVCGAGPASPPGCRSRRDRDGGGAEPGRSRRRLMTRGRPVTRSFPGPRGGAVSVVPKLRRFAPKSTPHVYTRSGLATGSWR